VQMTLWNWVRPLIERLVPRPVEPVAAKRPALREEAIQRLSGAEAGEVVEQVPARKEREPSASNTAKETAEERYERVARAMLSKYGIKVRKWRKSMSGVAYELKYRDGTVKRFIEAPRPRGPMSAAVFLHEIGHHAIGFNVYKPRCLEEYHAWAWSLRAMEEHGLNVTEQVRRRMHDSLWYAVSKAQRRGIKELPAELMAYTTRLPRKRRARNAS
jgi:hypothetical protein